MSSHEFFRSHPVDRLIAEALRAEVEGARPSPRVWERIRRRALAWAARHRPSPRWNWGAELARTPETEIFLLPPTSLLVELGAWRYTLPPLRLLDYAGLMFRFGW